MMEMHFERGWINFQGKIRRSQEDDYPNESRRREIANGQKFSLLFILNSSYKRWSLLFIGYRNESIST